MILSMLYDVNFIIGLLITIVLITIVAFYFSQRIEDQTEKISAVSVVVQAIAGELHELKYRISGGVGGGVGGVNVVPVVNEEQAIELSECDNINLIAVSDDEESDDEQDNVKSIHIGDCHNHDIVLKEITSNDSGSESDSDESESDSESSDSDSESSDSDSDEAVIEELSPDEEDKIDFQNICSDITVTEEDICSTLNILDELEELNELNDLVEVNGTEENVLTKSVNVSLEEEVVDYKKMTLSKLRSIVVEKQLSQDASKLKKGDIFKLLGIEQ